MTYTSLKTQLTTAAAAASITNFIFGYYDELHVVRPPAYPAMLVLPPNIPVNTRSGNDNQVETELEMWIFDAWSRESATARNTVWDGINTKAIQVFQSLQANATVYLLTKDAILGEPVDLGELTDNVIAMKYKFKVRSC
jgi:hypothetical protein